MSSSPSTFSDYAQSFRAKIDSALAEYSAFEEDCPAALREAIQYSLLTPGKRLRPTLVLMAVQACGCQPERAMPAACAVEMVHAYSLVHDDLPAMDDDDMRRGRPSCHARFGEANAILAGDALLALGFEVLARDIRPPEAAARCCAELGHAAGATAMVGGQAADLLAEHSGGGLEQLEAIHRRKTGAMFVVSLRLGGIVAQAGEEQLQALTRYGRMLGLAFQITDDLLDVQGSDGAVGKRTGKDAEKGKLTFPALLGVAESRGRATRLVEEACRSLHGFGRHAEGLELLARYVLERNH